MSDFQEKRALVTGGTRGIGAAVSIALAEAGCRVIATGLTDDEVEQFDVGGRTIEKRTLDVTDANGVKQLIAGLEGLDILVNCAGAILRGGREHTPRGFEKVVDINLNGTMRMCAGCRHLLDATNGSVVNIASMLSMFGSPVVPAYSASKGGVVQLTRSLAMAWAESGVRVNAVAPGWIETTMTEPLREDQARNDEILQRTPMRRWGKPEEIAAAILFLCSPAASFITGAVLPVDGGYSAA